MKCISNWNGHRTRWNPPSHVLVTFRIGDPMHLSIHGCIMWKWTILRFVYTCNWGNHSTMDKEQISHTKLYKKKRRTGCVNRQVQWDYLFVSLNTAYSYVTRSDQANFIFTYSWSIISIQNLLRLNSSKFVHRILLTIPKEEEDKERDIFCSLFFQCSSMHTYWKKKCYGKLVCDICYDGICYWHLVKSIWLNANQI